MADLADIEIVRSTAVPEGVVIVSGNELLVRTIAQASERIVDLETALAVAFWALDGDSNVDETALAWARERLPSRG